MITTLGSYRLVAAPTPPPRRGPHMAGLFVVGVALAAVFAIAAMMVATVPATVAPAACDPGIAVAAGTASVDGFTPEQLGNARAIIDAGRAMKIPARGWTVALATAMQESTLRNLGHGDRDSLGLFQQRPSMGWGSSDQVRDPAYSATKFYEGLLGIDGWEQLPVTVAAQRVQRSAFPAAYAKWEGKAAALVGALGQVADVSGCASRPVDADGGVDGVAGKVIDWARQQIGKPYRWGGTGPGSFDCSGLMMKAFGAAGVTLPRTSRAQFGIGAKIPREQARPGDLVFWGGNTTNPATIHHVAVYVGDDQVLEAPTAGQPVRIRPLKPTERGLFAVVVRPGATT